MTQGSKKSFLERFDSVLSAALVALMLLLVLAIVWQVLSRYILNTPSSVTEELARFSLIWVSLLGASYAYRHRMHLGLSILTEKLTGKSKLYADSAVLFFVSVFAVSVMIIGGGQLVLLTWELNQRTAVMGLPMAVIYSVIPISGALIVAYSLDLAAKLYTANKENEMGNEHE